MRLNGYRDVSAGHAREDVMRNPARWTASAAVGGAPMRLLAKPDGSTRRQAREPRAVHRPAKSFRDVGRVIGVRGASLPDGSALPRISGAPRRGRTRRSATARQPPCRRSAAEGSKRPRFGACGGGGSGIRTRDTVSGIHTFQACAFNHSATPPSANRAPGRARGAPGAARAARCRAVSRVRRPAQGAVGRAMRKPPGRVPHPSASSRWKRTCSTFARSKACMTCW